MENTKQWLHDIKTKIGNDLNGNSRLIDRMGKLYESFISYKNKKYLIKGYKRAERNIIKEIVSLYNNYIKQEKKVFDDDESEEEIDLKEKFNKYIYDFLNLLFEEMYRKRCSHFFCFSSFKKFYEKNVNKNSDIVKTILCSGKFSRKSVLSKEICKVLAIAAGLEE